MADDRAPDEDDGGNWRVENIVLLAVFAAIVGAGVWLLMTMADVRQAQDCAAQGRRNCGTLEIPECSR